MDPIRRHVDSPSAALDAEHRLLDEQLGRRLRPIEVPHGVAERVYAASVAYLPARPSLVLVRSGRRRVRATAWSQLAMAASVALACVVGVWSLRAPAPFVEAPEIHLASVPAALSVEAERVLFDRIGDADDDIAYLLETRDMTIGDISNELAMMVAELEM